MADRAKLLAEWRSRLHECEREIAEQGPDARWAWLRQMYARVLRYLVGTYGGEADADNPAEDAAATVDAASPPRMPYRENATVGNGKPARSAETIRNVLDTIHTRVPGVSAGSYRCGPDDPIIVESYRNRREAKKSLRLLKSKKLTGVRLKRAGRDVQLWANRADYEEARAVLAHARHLRSYEIPTTRFARCIARALKFGAGMGASLFFLFLIVSIQVKVGDAIAFLVVGMATGLTLAYLWLQRRR
jgi:hypothetical protein